MLGLPALLTLLPALLALVEPAQAFDYASAIANHHAPSSGAGRTGVVPNRYVLEFDNTDDARQVARRDGQGSLHDHIYAQLRSRNIQYTVSQTYDSELFVGASVALGDSNDYDALAGMAGISAIWPVTYINAPLAFSSSWGESQKTGYHPEWNQENLKVAGAKRAFEEVLNDRRDKKDDEEKERKKQEKNDKKKPKTSSTAASSTAAPAPTAVTNNTAQPQAQVPNGYGFLPISGVDKVHAEGNTGQGVRIAIIDSGVFYTNPALGGCFGPGCLVAGGRDYVGDEFDGVNGLAPDDDPLDCTGHGTFVTGIVGAQLPNRYNVSGVAPGSSIYAYRVFSCYSATTNDIVAKAMQDAFTDGNDIINLSLGETSSWSGSMLSVIGSRIAARGVSVMASAGNGGYAGTFYTESPGSGVDVLSVGSVDNVNFPGQNATLSFRQRPLSYIGLDNLGPGTFPLVSFTNGAASQNDGCPVPADFAGIDFATTVLVFQQSAAAGCDIYTQGDALATAGVQRALLITSQGGEGILPPRFGFQLGVISYEDGQEILQQIAQGNRPTGTFAFAPNAVANKITGGLVSLGSALGPTNDMYMKPQLVAPGNNIVSTAPTASGFGASGGTSYSCSYVAGVAALYLSANGGRASSGISASEITRALEITSNPLPVSKSDSRLNTVAIVGAGLVQAYDVIHTPIEVSKSELLLNDTANFADYQTFDVVNTGRDRLKFSLSHVPAQTAYSLKQGSYESELAPVPLLDNAARVKFVPPVLNLKPGQSKQVVVKFDLPRGLDERRLPVYSGYVQIEAGNGQYQVQVPYLGVAASMKSFPVLDSSRTFTGDALPNLVDGNMSVQTGERSYTLEGTDAPSLMYRLWVGSPLLTVDLINPDQSLPFKPTIDSPTYTVPPTSDDSDTKPGKGNGKGHGKGKGNGKGHGKGKGKGKHHKFGPLSWWNWNGNQDGPASGVDYDDSSIVGNVFERMYIPRNSDGQDGNGIENYAFNGTFTNATIVADGSYRLLVRALRVSGDADDQADYDSWVSPVVTIARPVQA